VQEKKKDKTFSNLHSANEKNQYTYTRCSRARQYRHDQPSTTDMTGSGLMADTTELIG
jgi:hypothetical protein